MALAASKPTTAAAKATTPGYVASPKVLTPKKQCTPTPMNSPAPVAKRASLSAKKLAMADSEEPKATPIKAHATKRARKSPVKSVVASPSQQPAKRTRKAAAGCSPAKASKASPAKSIVLSPPKLAARAKRCTKAVAPEPESESEVDAEEMEEAVAILCDGCDEEFFCDEVGLDEVPEGDWFCAGCEKKRNAKAKKALVKKPAAKKPAAKKAPVAKKPVAKATAKVKEVVDTGGPVRRSTRAR
jgi:hypothetical protein